MDLFIQYIHEDVLLYSFPLSLSPRADYRRDAQLVYQKRMLDATKGKGRFPLIRTFRSGLDTSTNSVYHDMDQAERW